MKICKEYNTVNDFYDFFWSGARDRWNTANHDQKEMVVERIREFCECSLDTPTETEVNDLVWFDCDDIFFPKNDNEND